MSSDHPQNRPSSRAGRAGKVSPKKVELVLSQSPRDPSAKKTHLSLSEAHALVQRAKAGEAKAWRQLWNYYAGMLRHTAVKMKVPDADLEEAIAEGLIGLQIAIANYPPGDPEHFTEYARRWVQRSVRRYANSLRRGGSDG